MLPNEDLPIEGYNYDNSAKNLQGGRRGIQVRRFGSPQNQVETNQMLHGALSSSGGAGQAGGFNSSTKNSGFKSAQRSSNFIRAGNSISSSIQV